MKLNERDLGFHGGFHGSEWESWDGFLGVDNKAHPMKSPRLLVMGADHYAMVGIRGRMLKTVRG